MQQIHVRDFRFLEVHPRSRSHELRGELQKKLELDLGEASDSDLSSDSEGEDDGV